MREQKFREKKLSSGKIILLGKNAEQNEILVKKFRGKKNIILHTVAPGSPFCVIKELNLKVKDIKETAVFCARYSQDWRDNKKDVRVNYFSGRDVFKRKNMPAGTFGVKNSKTVKVNKKDVEKLLEEER